MTPPSTTNPKLPIPPESQVADHKYCDLCNNDQFERIADRDRKGQPWPTVMCTVCGLVCHENIPSEAELSEYYSRKYREGYKGETTPSARRILRAWRKGQRVFGALQHQVKPHFRVFEVGAGSGCNLKPFQLTGCDVAGIEPHLGFQAYGRDKLHVPLTCGSVFDYKITNPYDLVLLIHVIEHFRSPRRALRRIHRLIKPGGLLYLECPSLATPFVRLADHFHYAHIHTFTPATLLNLAGNCGFEMEECHADGLGTNHKYLFRRVDLGAQEIDDHGYLQTIRIIQEHHARWRYLQPRYVWRRLRRVYQYIEEYVRAESEVKRLLARSQFRVQKVAA